MCESLFLIGDITNEDKVLEWLIANRKIGDDDEKLEEVDANSLEAMVSSSEGIVVLFCKRLKKAKKMSKKPKIIIFADDADSRKAENLLEVMEQIDDDCARRGIQFVKVSEEGVADSYGVARLPSLVFFKSDLPSVYEGK